MPDSTGRFRGIAVPRVPWNEPVDESPAVSAEPWLRFLRGEITADEYARQVREEVREEVRRLPLQRRPAR